MCVMEEIFCFQIAGGYGIFLDGGVHRARVAAGHAGNSCMSVQEAGEEVFGCGFSLGGFCAQACVCSV